MFKRLINPSKSKSFFLFGARGTGKTTFLKSFFHAERVLHFDLLDPEIEELFSLHPEEFRRQILAQLNNFDWIVVDEVQKCPKILNSVHKLIVENNLKFALTGSSSRKLKQKGVNLLAGRALTEVLFPLTHLELKEQFNLVNTLHFGSLPEVINEPDPQIRIKFLRSYALNYLQQEIQAEQWVRNLEPFRRFLPIAANTSGKILNYSNIAKDIGSSPATVMSYFDILEDTLVGFRLPAYHSSVRKQQRIAPKFYFFDCGLKRALQKALESTFTASPSAFGDAFEEFFVNEVHRILGYLKPDYELFYLLTKDGAEIDLIVTRPGQPPVLVEIKSKTQVDERDARNLVHFRDDFPNSLKLIASNDPREKQIFDIHALPWQNAIQMLLK